MATSASRAKGLSDRSVQKAFRTLYRAMGDTGLPVNPAALPKHRLPRVRTQRPKTRPPVHEVNAFLDHVQECDLPGRSADYPLWRVVAVTGVRRGELCALTWDNVDLDAGTIHIERSLGVDEGKLYAKGTKNQEGDRIIGIDSITMSALRMHRARLRAERLQAGADYNTHPLGLDFVFRWDDTGAPVKPDRVTVRFRREWKHFGGQPGVSLQSLRRSHGTELLASNVPITRAAARMGHSPDVFLRLYVRDNDEAARQGAMRELTEELYGGAAQIVKPDLWWWHRRFDGMRGTRASEASASVLGGGWGCGGRLSEAKPLGTGSRCVPIWCSLARHPPNSIIRVCDSREAERRAGSSRITRIGRYP